VVVLNGQATEALCDAFYSVKSDGRQRYTDTKVL